MLLIGGGYFIYERFFTKKALNPWQVVPADAVLVYEKDDCKECVDALSKSLIVRLLTEGVFYKKIVDDSLKSKLGKAVQENSSLLVSVHRTKKDDLDFVIYSSGALSDFLPAKFRKTSREFSSIAIEEYKSQGMSVSVAKIENVYILSFTPFLIEDVIRTYKSGSNASFRNSISKVQSLSRIADDGGNLYINYKNLADLLAIFSSSDGLGLNIGTAGALDIKTNENSVVLNGFSLDSAGGSGNLLSVFKNQSPVAFGLKQLISNRVSALSSYGISDGERFHSEFLKFVRAKRPKNLDTLNRLETEHRVKFKELYTSIGDEFGVCLLESSARNDFSKIVLVETSDPVKWTKTFETLAEKLSVDTIFYEKYSDFEIREIPVHKFTEKLLWPFVTGFTQNFYTRSGNVILIADNLEDLKNYIDEVEADDTWGRSVSQNQFLESTLLESNISLYVNTFRTLNLLTRKLHPKWQQFARDNQNALLSLQMLSFQFSHLNNSFYTNVLLTYRDEPVKTNSRKSKDRTVTNFDRGIAKLYAVRSHVTRNDEVLIQDSLNDLSLVGSDGKVLWKLSIGDRITSDVSQVDFFKNGKLQYFFTTQDAIHIIDRLGNYVDPYPLYVPNVKIEFVSIVDYDNSKKYRFLAGDVDGKLWMYDKDGNNLDGWKPNAVGGPLAMPARHYRIKGKDYLIAVLKNGKVFLMNRRGEELRKFPLNSESIPSGDLYLERGSGLSDTYFVIISNDGFRVKINPEGKIQSRETLQKNSINSVFSLIPEKSNKSYLVLQQDGKLLTLTDEAGRKVVSTSFGLVNPADVKYYDFGAGKIFITIADKVQGLVYVFDGQGNLLTTPPIQSSALEIRPVNSHSFNVFYVHNKSLIIQPL